MYINYVVDFLQYFTHRNSMHKVPCPNSKRCERCGIRIRSTVNALQVYTRTYLFNNNKYRYVMRHAHNYYVQYMFLVSVHNYQGETPRISVFPEKFQIFWVAEI
jgi:hypothetical protein